MSSEVTAYINAGGRGTRLQGVLRADPEIGISKALIPVGIDAQPIVAYHIKRLLRRNIRNIVVACGDHEPVAEYVADNFGNESEVTVLLAENQEGTGGDLKRAIDNYAPHFADTTLVLNVDTLLDVDEEDLLRRHSRFDTDGTLVVTTKKNAPNHGAFLIAASGQVVENKEACSDLITVPTEVSVSSVRASSCGMVALRTASFSTYDVQGEFSIYRDFLGSLTRRGGLSAFNNEERFFMDIGVPETYTFVQENPAIITALMGSADLSAVA